MQLSRMIHVLKGEIQDAKGSGLDRVQASIPSFYGHINTNQQQIKDQQLSGKEEKETGRLESTKQEHNTSLKSGFSPRHIGNLKEGHALGRTSDFSSSNRIDVGNFNGPKDGLRLMVHVTF